MKRTIVTGWIGLLVLTAGGLAEQAVKNTAVVPVRRADAWWAKRHDDCNARAKQGNVDLLFIGDSITQGWEGGGKEVWDKYYGPRKAMNIGFSGDRTQHVLWRLDHGNIDGISPKAAVLMIGTNNSSREDNTAEEIAEGITAIVRKLRVKLPQTKVLILAIFPRCEKPAPQREKNAKASEIVAKLADGDMIHYMDIGKEFMQPDQSLSKEIMPDFLHLSPKGYEIWARSIEPKLVELLGEKK
jgi:lysophospholipase L1-like esterase